MPAAAPRARRFALKPALLAALLTALLALAGPVGAVVIYTYTGPTFTLIRGSGGYSTSDRVTGTLTRSQPLAPNTTYTVADFSAWSFTDGHMALNQSNGTPGGNNPALYFTVSTDAAGQIAAWRIFALSSTMTAVGAHGQYVYLDSISSPKFSEGASDAECLIMNNSFCNSAPIRVGGTVKSVGTWSRSIVADPAAVPALSPAALAGLALGLPLLAA